ncbi:hypothetical protein [Lysinibacillus fusiformis]|uniref:Uncharacterized protein n=1 Tax=Lysinibacillus fusiformis TaxID=28031 RepID=A0A1H9SNT5_9BACI|nr:hypothetical protein [Lysinibacillus fusiformis]SCY85011.1 hypothetical protein SAMN02787081_04776 [Lysinibacillus fusiformis]SEO52631.1 hypothetical protein SAMN02787103_04638 [Lysinibacillus fusiformis]SER86672.1 hypothetical protein SAMN02787113_04781 [Lysinibacillus fusiformis]
MSNLKGAILATALFAAVVFPFLLMMSIDAFQQHAFLKMTEEVTELVKEEGGVSEHVAQVTKRLKTKDLTVTFSKPGLVKFGEEIVIGYNYEYQNVRGKKTLDGQDVVIIMKRSTGKNGSNSNETNPPTEIAKSYSAKTPESLQPDKEYTFTVPGLKNLMSVTADMGKVEVVRVDGEKVTVKVSGGKVVKTVQTGGTNTLADEKYVTGEDSADYDKNGYTGTLERYLYSGKLMPADSKVITNTKTSLLTGAFPGSVAYSLDGYSGILLKNGDPIKTVFSGEYTPADNKEVTEDLMIDGIDEKKEVVETVKGTAWEWFTSDLEKPKNSYYYSKDGFVGTLTAQGKPVHNTIRSSEHDRYQTVWLGFNSNEKADLEKDISLIKGFGDQREDETGIDFVTRRTLELYPNYSNLEVILDSIEWDTEVLEGEFGIGGFYKYQRNVKLHFYADLFNVEQTYEGIVERNSIDPFPETIEYNKDGYTGTLKRYLVSGEYTPSDTKYVSDQSSQNYNKDGYSGILERYVKSGSYVPGDSKYVENQDTAYYNKDGYTGSLQAYLVKQKETILTIVNVFEPQGAGCPPTSNGGFLADERNGLCYYGKFVEVEREDVVKYRGTVSKPGIDTRVYAYKGNVTKPAVDTRVCTYKGTVTKPATDTRIYEYVQNYTGTVTRPEMDTRIYKYRGTVKRPASDSRTYEDYYQYELNFRYM